MRGVFIIIVLFCSTGLALEKYASVYFAFDSSEIPLRRLDLKNLETNNYFLIKGYTDSFGDESYNLQLSKERAESVRDTMISQYNIEESRVKVTFYGEDKDVNKKNEYKRRVEIASGSLSEINLIINGLDIKQKSDSVNTSGLEVDEISETAKRIPQSENKNDSFASSDESLKEDRLGKRHSLFLKLNSFHSELAGEQTRGVGVSSSANEILTDPNLSGELSYRFKLTKSFQLKAIIDFKNYIFAEELDSKIIEEQKNLALNPGIGLIYNFSDEFNISLDLYLFEQVFYGANGLGNLIFDYERLLRFEFHPEYLILSKRKYDLGFGIIGTYHNKKGDVSSAFGWGSELFINAFYGKRFRFHVKYYDVRYEFVSSEIKNELLELGVGYRWEF